MHLLQAQISPRRMRITFRLRIILCKKPTAWVFMSCSTFYTWATPEARMDGTPKFPPPAPADMTTWGAYCGARWGGYDNIIWVVGGDQNPSSYMTKLTACANGILSQDTRHLITIHNGPDPVTGVDNSGDPSWYTLNNIYGDWTDIGSLAATAYARTPTSPFLLIEGYYENDRATEQQCRMQNYNTVLAGRLAGFIFGNDPIWYFGSGWAGWLDANGSLDTIRAKTFFEAVAWHMLAPDAHAVLTSGYGTIGTADYATCSVDSGGTLAAIYMPSNRTMTIDMTQFSGTVTARWYDPTNGSYTADAASPLSNTGTHDFSRAGANSAGDHDWLLLLEVG